MAILRRLLTDRFQRAFYGERKELPIYALTVAKGGSKLNESTLVPESIPRGPPPLIFVISPQGASLPARCATMAEFASLLERTALARPVVDKNGLTGRYDFDSAGSPTKPSSISTAPPPAPG